MRAFLILIAAIVTLLGVAALNFVYVVAPALPVLRDDLRNSKVTMIPHLRYGVDPTVLVLDLISVDPQASMADVDRVMFQTAHALRSRKFETVHFAYRGKAKFVLPGSDFQEIGRDYEIQNPIYTIRTLPEKLSRPDGTRPFGIWTGGMLGVLAKQLEDHNAMHSDWYLQEIASAR